MMKEISNDKVYQNMKGMILHTCFLGLLLALSTSSSVVADDHFHEHSHENIAHDDKDKHTQHEEHTDELTFSTEALKEFSIQLSHAKSGEISKTINLTGEVIIAPERLHHVVPLVKGSVKKVYKRLGDQVKAGDLLVTLSSRELADAKAAFVAADSLLQLANASLKREYDLFKNKVTAKRHYLLAKQAHAERAIKRKAALQQLLAIGLTKTDIKALLKNTDKDLTLYKLYAPSTGVIIEKHAAQGEVLETNHRSFTLADLSHVWVNLTVYQKDLAFIKQGQSVAISAQYGGDKQNVFVSQISWLSPVLDESTRSAKARVVIDNATGQWRPGLFVNAKLVVSTTAAKIVVPLSALQTIEGQTVVFIQHQKGEFKPQAVKIGRRDYQQVEILQGLILGQEYVSKNAFSLKAQLQKGSFGHGHSH